MTYIHIRDLVLVAARVSEKPKRRRRKQRVREKEIRSDFRAFVIEERKLF